MQFVACIYTDTQLIEKYEIYSRLSGHLGSRGRLDNRIIERINHALIPALVEHMCMRRKLTCLSLW